VKVKEGCISLRPATPPSHGTRPRRPPIFLDAKLRQYGFDIERTIRLGNICRESRFHEVSHAPHSRGEAHRSSISGIPPYLCLRPLTQND